MTTFSREARIPIARGIQLTVSGTNAAMGGSLEIRAWADDSPQAPAKAILYLGASFIASVDPKLAEAVYALIDAAPNASLEPEPERPKAPAVPVRTGL